MIKYKKRRQVTHFQYYKIIKTSMVLIIIVKRCHLCPQEVRCVFYSPKMMSNLILSKKRIYFYNDRLWDIIKTFHGLLCQSFWYTEDVLYLKDVFKTWDVRMITKSLTLKSTRRLYDVPNTNNVPDLCLKNVLKNIGHSQNSKKLVISLTEQFISEFYPNKNIS